MRRVLNLANATHSDFMLSDDLPIYDELHVSASAAVCLQVLFYSSDLVRFVTTHGVMVGTLQVHDR